MPTPTPTEQNAQRTGELGERLVELTGKVERHEDVSRRGLQSLKEEIAVLATELGKLKDSVHSSDVASGRHDERIKALEKGRDRSWQFAPIAISICALVAAVVFGVVNSLRK